MFLSPDDYKLTCALCILKLVSTQYTTREGGEPLLISTTVTQTTGKYSMQVIVHVRVQDDTVTASV